jgi:hypothetical protein
MRGLLMRSLVNIRKFLRQDGFPARFWLSLLATIWLILFIALLSVFDLTWASLGELLPVALWLILLVAEVMLLIVLVDRRRKGKQPPEDNEARAAFARSRERFRDLIVELWCCAENDEAPDGGRLRVLERWRERLERLEEPALLRAWVEATGLSSSDDEAWARRGAAHWLRRLESWGLTRFHPATVEINEKTLHSFHFFPLRGSGTAVVKSPSWSFNGEVLQKGNAVVEYRQ